VAIGWKPGFSGNRWQPLNPSEMPLSRFRPVHTSPV
jgi:hypothetical protein